MIHGITVRLYDMRSGETDGFNNPIRLPVLYEDVENVLVSPSSADDIVDSTNLYGKKSIYTLGIPKGDEHLWTDQVVEFFGEFYHVYSFPIRGIEANVPTAWHDKYYCERYEVSNQM